MKTYKHLYARVHAFENLEAAWRNARRGKRGRPSVAAFEANAEEEYCRVDKERKRRIHLP